VTFHDNCHASSRGNFLPRHDTWQMDDDVFLKQRTFASVISRLL
jgi:hypothetical protein